MVQTVAATPVRKATDALVEAAESRGLKGAGAQEDGPIHETLDQLDGVTMVLEPVIAEASERQGQDARDDGCGR